MTTTVNTGAARSASARTTRARVSAAILSVVMATSGAALLASSPAEAATCPASQGSLPRTAAATEVGPLVNVRGGRQTCYERLVFDFALPADGYSVRYVDQVRSDGSGAVVPLRGGARIEIVLFAPAYDSNGKPTYRPANPAELVNVSGWTTFRQVAWGGSYEGYTTIGLGVRARLPFRVFTLDGPGSGSRIVVDVAHRW